MIHLLIFKGLPSSQQTPSSLQLHLSIHLSLLMFLHFPVSQSSPSFPPFPLSCRATQCDSFSRIWWVLRFNTQEAGVAIGGLFRGEVQWKVRATSRCTSLMHHVLHFPVVPVTLLLSLLFSPSYFPFMPVIDAALLFFLKTKQRIFL